MRRATTCLRALVQILWISGASACSSAAPVERPASTSPTPTGQTEATGPAMRRGAPVALSLRTLPAELALDGALDDWGLDATQPGVTVGVDAQRVVVALSWGRAEPSVLSLALATRAPALPSVDSSQREAYRERFVRRLRVEGGVVSLVDARGASSPISGAKLEIRGSSAEIELPLSALPELDHAPLSHLLGVAMLGELPEALRSAPLRAHPSSADAPPLAEGWSHLELTTPVGFGTLSELLAVAFAQPNGGLRSQRSYSPSKPESILVVSVPDVAVAASRAAPNVPGVIGGPRSPDRPALSIAEEPLSTPIETFGELSVALSSGSVVTLRANRVVSNSGFPAPEATQRRGAELHLFHYDEGGFSWDTGFMPPAWRVLAVRPDGSTAEISDEGVDEPGIHGDWDDTPTTFHNGDWTSFGMRGQRKGAPKLVTWRWNPSKARYVVSAVPPQSWP